MNDLKATLLAELQRRKIDDSGFRSQAGADYRADASACAILAYQALGLPAIDLRLARTRLAADQQSDGRISISPEHPEAYWPTALAILAWQPDAAYRAAQARAVQFLLHTTGNHHPRQPDAPYAHDSSLKGWPWVEGTHNWVIPSALGIIALEVDGFSKNERVQEALRLLLDRQLPHGGWNYGNTRVYGQELHPLVESTGLALNALAGSVSRPEINSSLEYLKKALARTITPLSLSWGLLGLGSWGEEPSESPSWLEACWRRQERYGSYDTTALSLMILALCLPQGILSLF
jgi:hypothetical protein